MGNADSSHLCAETPSAEPPAAGGRRSAGSTATTRRTDASPVIYLSFYEKKREFRSVHRLLVALISLSAAVVGETFSDLLSTCRTRAPLRTAARRAPGNFLPVLFKVKALLMISPCSNSAKMLIDDRLK